MFEVGFSVWLSGPGETVVMRGASHPLLLQELFLQNARRGRGKLYSEIGWWWILFPVITKINFKNYLRSIWNTLMDIKWCFYNLTNMAFATKKNKPYLKSTSWAMAAGGRNFACQDRLKLRKAWIGFPIINARSSTDVILQHQVEWNYTNSPALRLAHLPFVRSLVAYLSTVRSHIGSYVSGPVAG